MPVGDGAIPVVALQFHAGGRTSPTYILPLTDAEFTDSYLSMLKYHLNSVQAMFNDFLNHQLGNPDDYSQQ